MMSDLRNWWIKNSLSPWLYVTTHIVTVRYIKSTKFLPKVIGIWPNIWHNDDGSIVHKSRRIGYTSAYTPVTSGFNNECSIIVFQF